MEFTAEKTFPATLEMVARSVAWAREATIGAELPQPRALHLELLVEEVVANAVRHGHAGRTGEFRIRISGDVGFVHVEIEDDGIGFDPTLGTFPPGGPGGPRAAGGLGLLLLRRIARDLSYRREGRRNRLAFDLTAGA